MARRNKGGGGDEGGNWMDTYGDLVTLLLTFFVLLYSMSSLDQSKWNLFVRSIYPGMEDDTGDTAESNQVVIDGKVQTTTESPEEVRDLGDPEVEEEDLTAEDLGNLYITLAQKLQDAGISDSSVSRGKDYTFVRFNDKAFFDGDSSELTDSGKETLDIFCSAIAPLGDQISQINIMGHTAQGDPNKPNTIRTDRVLSSMRAAEVCIYIQNKNVVAPEKLVTIAYGQYRPITSNDTYEGRASNRRVEILILDKDAQIRNMDDYYREIEDNTASTITTDGSSGSEDATPGDESTDNPVTPGQDAVSTLVTPADGSTEPSETEQQAAAMTADTE